MSKNTKRLKIKGGDEDKISRKEALKTAGKYAAFTAASMLLVLSPKEAQAASGFPDDPPEW